MKKQYTFFRNFLDSAISKRSTLVLISLLILINACAEPPKPRDIYWPAPPDVPRIKFVKAMYSSKEVKKDTFMSKVKELISGVADVQRMAKPFGIFAKGGRVFVADTVQRSILVFDYNDSSFSFLGRTAGPGRLKKPLDLYISESDTIYVCDASLNKVVIYDKKLKYLRSIGKKGEIDRPGGVVANESLKRIYITDIIRHNVHVYDLQGNKLFDFGQRGVENGEFNYPTNMTIDKEGIIYIVDSMNFRVQVFDSDGKFLFRFGDVGDQFGNFARPKGIALDSDGHIYVTDAAFNNIQIFTNKGQLLLFFSQMGYKRGELWMPSGIAIDEKNKIYVADQYNHRVNVYQYLTDSEGKAALEKKQGTISTAKEEEG